MRRTCSTTLRRRSAPRRAGFTLIEALMASGILLAVVMSVTTAITAGQQHSWEAQQRIAATLAVEELLGRIIVNDYNAIAAFNGYTEPVGAMVDMNNQPMPDVFLAIGREVSVITTMNEMPGLGVRVEGREVEVRAFDSNGRVLAEVTTFIPEPASGAS